MEKEKKENRLAKTRDEQLLAMRNLGGASSDTSQLDLPSLKLEHTLNNVGEPNPDKGMFTLSVRDGLGGYKKEVLGEEIVIHFLLQRYKLSFVDNETKYSSPEFDTPNESVTLWKAVGQGDDRKSEIFAEGTADELGKKFLITKNNRTFSQLKLLVVLYGELAINGGTQLVKWSTNVSGTVGFRKFARKTTPFAVVARITREEAIAGTNKYYQPKFNVLEEVSDFAEVLEKQKHLLGQIKFGSEVAADIDETIGIAE